MTSRITSRKGNRRRRDPREARARVRANARVVLGFVGRLLLASLLVGGTFSSVVGLWYWATTSPTFAVRDVVVEGNVRARLDELAPLTGLEAGANIFRVETEAAEAGLERHPWVRRASVRRDPPGRVEIRIEEHVPVAIANLDALYLVNEQAEVFKRLVPGDPVDLPILTGLTATPEPEGAGATAGHATSDHAALEARGPEAEVVAREAGDRGVGAAPGRLGWELGRGLALVSTWRNSALAARATLSQVHLEPVRGVTLTVRPQAEGAPPLVIHLGREDTEKRLARLEKLYTLLAERGELPREVFLDNGNRPQWVVARVRD